MTGMNATEFGFLFHVLSEETAPGLAAGWTEEQITNQYKRQFKATGGDESKVPEFLNTLKKLYAAGRDMTGQHEYSRVHSLYAGDAVSFTKGVSKKGILRPLKWRIFDRQ